MKGQIVIRFQVPNQGLVANLPKHLVGPDVLTNGNNVFVDLDGRLKTRRGLLSITGSALNPAERILGIGSYEDNNGVFFPVVGTASRWQALQAGTWTDISGGTLLSGNSNDPVRFTSFQSNGKSWIVGANNNNVLFQWNSSLAAYAPLSSSPIAKDVVTIANRVVTFNTVEGGVRNPFRVRWSAINDQTTWPPLGFNDLMDTGNSIIGAALTSRLSAVIYRQSTPWFMQAVPGGDPNAFGFDRIPGSDQTVGPVGAASIVVAEGNHYYFGIDGRIWQFNGTTVQPISDRADPIIRGAYNNSFPTRYFSTYVPTYRQLCFFFAAFGSSDPNACVVFDLRRGVFEPLWTFSSPLTAANVVRDSSGPNWTKWVDALATWLTIPYATWADIPAGNQLSTYAGDTAGNVTRFAVANTDNGAPIPYAACWGLQRSSDELSQVLVHFIEFYQTQSITDDQIVATVSAYLQPEGVGSEQVRVTSMTLITADQTTFYKTLSPGPGGDNNIRGNLIQLTMSAQKSAGQFSFSGATLLCDVDLRGDYVGLGPQ